MIFPKNKNRTITFLSVVLAIVILAGVVLGNPGILGGAGATGGDLPRGDSTVVTTATVATSTAVATQTAATTKVVYGNYPALDNIGYGSYVKLDYQETSGKNTYFYDFRNDWRSGCIDLKGEYATKLSKNKPGFYGVTASADKNVITYTAYTELDNVTLRSAQFRTYDNAKSQALGAEANAAYQFSVKSLANGPYSLCVWFDYTDANGVTQTLCAWTPVYVSNGNAWFAKTTKAADNAAVEKWLTENRNSLAADDAFQAWMSKSGGDDLDAGLRLDNITYPYYSNTQRYPNNVSKWQGLAHEICPDENATDFRKAYLLHGWMASNLVYDKRASTGKLPLRWAENGSGEFSTWNTHLGVCHDFANIYAIMCRELGVPCRIVSDKTHSYNAVYLDGRWELVDVTWSCDSADIENSQAAIDAFWKDHKSSSKVQIAGGFLMAASGRYKIGSYEADKYPTVEAKLAALKPLDADLSTKALLKSLGGAYNH